jgi:hypothetical protein
MSKAELSIYIAMVVATIALAAVKLTGMANISWGFVLFPIWGQIAAFVLLLGGTMLVTLLVMLYSIFVERRGP